jgi:hypothetical protein
MVLLQMVELEGVTECRVMEAWEGADATTEVYAQLVDTWRRRWGFDRYRFTGDPSMQNRELTDGRSVAGELARRYHIHSLAPHWLKDVPDRVRLMRDFMAGRKLNSGKMGRFAYRGELELLADRLSGAAWPTNAEGW